MSTAIAPPPIRDVGETSVRTVRAARMFGTELSTPWPARGLICSVLAHLLFLLATLLVPWNYWLPAVRLVTMQTQVREQELLLPDLQPMGSAARPAPAPGPKPGPGKKTAEPAPAKASSPAPAAAAPVQGVVHPAPQIIVSNSPHPDNTRQTILQPDLAKAPQAAEAAADPADGLHCSGRAAASGSRATAGACA